VVSFCGGLIEKSENLPFDEPDDSRGAYRLGTMYLFWETTADAVNANETIFHEFVGHFGPRGFFGAVLNDDVIDSIHAHLFCPRVFHKEKRVAGY